MPYDDLKIKARNIRKNILKMIYTAKGSHIGSGLSIVEILTALYFKVMNVNPKNIHDDARDIFILSKGHAVVALYAALIEAGFCDETIMEKYAANGSHLAGHTIRDSVPGIEISSGSLGHGLPIAVGMALGAKMNKMTDKKVFCLMGDGECDEGSVWEATMFAAQNILNNLRIIVDLNGQQGMGESENIISQKNIAEKFRSFGCDVYEVDGHNFEELLDAFARESDTRPIVVIAKTVKGKGVSFMENSVVWHYKNPTDEQYTQALNEIESSI